MIGGSAGAIEALREIVRDLPERFPAPICVVQHISPESPGLLPSIFSSIGQLPAVHASHGALVRAGHIYIAPPDRHFLLNAEGRIILGAGPRENRFRPAIDPLFRSAASHFGPKSIGVILSGGLDDGVAGLAAIKAAGGVAIVQRPEEALAPSMPASAIEAVSVDSVLSVQRMAPVLADLARTAVDPGIGTPTSRKELEMENCIAAGGDPKEMNLDALGGLSQLTCPDCGGVLRRLNDLPLRYRCHTGHAYTAGTLGDAIRKRASDAVWAALRRHHEEEDFLNEAVRLREEAGDTEAAAVLLAEIKRTAATAEKLRAILEDVPED